MPSVNPADLRVGQVVRVHDLWHKRPIYVTIDQLFNPSGNFLCHRVTMDGRRIGRDDHWVNASQVISILSQPSEVASHV